MSEASDTDIRLGCGGSLSMTAEIKNVTGF